MTNNSLNQAFRCTSWGSILLVLKSRVIELHKCLADNGRAANSTYSSPSLPIC